MSRVETVTGNFVDGAQVAPPGPGAARFTARNAAYLSVVPEVESYSPAGERLLQDVRSVPAPFPALTTGPAAQLVDSLDALRAAMPWALAVIVVSSLVLLFLFTGSVVLPFKALILNTLSLSATFGALVWGFQEGHLSGVLGDFAVTGTITWTVPILLFCVAFGLSMDYEVFLLSQVKEEYDRTGDNLRSVALGIERIGQLVTAAAALMAIVFIRVHHLRHHLPQGGRPGAGARRHHRRHPGTRRAHAGLHAAGGEGELVGTGPAPPAAPADRPARSGRGRSGSG